uniref:Uncharacterized protein n=1 Tax=Manihot esculenta TaxID=3983 RepID=A0A2C9VXZ0_MANES
MKIDFFCIHAAFILGTYKSTIRNSMIIEIIVQLESHCKHSGKSLASFVGKFINRIYILD